LLLIHHIARLAAALTSPAAASPRSLSTARQPTSWSPFSEGSDGSAATGDAATGVPDEGGSLLLAGGPWPAVDPRRAVVHNKAPKETLMERCPLVRTPRRGVPFPLRSAFAVSHDPDGLRLSEPSDVFQPVTFVGFGHRWKNPPGIAPPAAREPRGQERHPRNHPVIGTEVAIGLFAPAPTLASQGTTRFISGGFPHGSGPLPEAFTPDSRQKLPPLTRPVLPHGIGESDRAPGQNPRHGPSPPGPRWTTAPPRA
jgi:hypothetical protein